MWGSEIKPFNHVNVVVVVVVVLTPVCPAVPVADIKAVITGKDCPHMKEKGALKQNKVRLRAWMQQWACKQAGGCFYMHDCCVI